MGQAELVSPLPSLRVLGTCPLLPTAVRSRTTSAWDAEGPDAPQPRRGSQGLSQH